MQKILTTSAPARKAPRSAPAADNTNWSLLAGLRFFLACIVIGEHLVRPLGQDNPLTRLKSFDASVAVFGFLIISGYSIRASIERNPDGFLMRRAHRIWPIYLTCFAIAVIPWLWAPAVVNWKNGDWLEMPTPKEFISSALMLQMILVAPMKCFAPSWSMAVEWWYYVLTPLVKRIRLRYVAALMLLSILSYLNGPLPLSQVPVWGFTSCAWAWLLGWILYSHRENIWVRAFVFTVPTALAGRDNAPYMTMATFAMVVSVFIIVFNSELLLPKWPAKVLSWLGDISFPLYMVHFPLFLWIYVFVPHAAPWVYPVAALAASVVLFYGVDIPTRFRERKPITAPISFLNSLESAPAECHCVPRCRS